MTHGVEAARFRDTVYVRIAGLGNFNNAGPLRQYVEAMIGDGARTIVLDMAQCSGVDSTFLGTMMGFMVCPVDGEAQSRSLDHAAVHVTVVNPTPPAQRSMDSLGLSAILDIRAEPVAPPDVKLERLSEGWLDEAQRVELIERAHQRLIDLDQRNAERFGPFLAALRKEREQRG